MTRRTRIALSIIALFGLNPAEAANTIFVTSCTDNGAADTGNLRNSIAMAADGDTVDATLLTTCVNSTITLTQGQVIPIAVNNLTIQGPGLLPPQILTIDGRNNALHGMFQHTGTGALHIYNLALNHAYNTVSAGTAAGGAIYTAGTLYLSGVNIYNSVASTVSGKALGGAVYTKGRLFANTCKLMQNKAVPSGSAATSQGGAVFAKGGGSIAYSTVSGNVADGVVDNQGWFGGVYLGNSALIQRSTISNNTAHAHVGGIGMLNKQGVLTFNNSTVSGNTAVKGPIGGVWAYANSVSLTNTTITLNSAGMPSFSGGSPLYAPGLAVTYAYLSMASTLIANNGYGATPTQLDLTLGRGTLRTVTNNLVHTTALTLPTANGNKTGVCPLLGPLRNNGGLTKTHALLSRSPAIDAGSGAPFGEDQRGMLFDTAPLPFPRQSGTAVDIGAYEVQQNDIVFNTSFETCP